MLHDENRNKRVIWGQKVAKLQPKTISSSSLLKNKLRSPDLCMALIVKTKHLKDNLPDALQSSWCNGMQQEVPLEKKKVSHRKWEPGVNLRSLLNTLSSVAAPQSSQGSARKTDSFALESRGTNDAV